jgi:hypothetical protein
VKNEQGQPVAGAKVEIYNAIATVFSVIPAGPPQPGIRPVPCEWLAEDNSAIIADAEGRWSSTNAPEDADLQLGKSFDTFRFPAALFRLPLRLRVSHPDYAAFDGSQDANIAGAPTLAELRSQDAAVVLKPKGESYKSTSSTAGWPQSGNPGTASPSGARDENAPPAQSR